MPTRRAERAVGSLTSSAHLRDAPMPYRLGQPGATVMQRDDVAGLIHHLRGLGFPWAGPRGTAKFVN